MSVPELAAYLRRPPAAHPIPLTLASCDRAREHGVAALLYRAVRDARLFDVQPEPVRERLAAAARDQMALDAIRRVEIVRVLDALATAGVSPLLFKGAALAYTLYPEPWLRQRTDTDLLVRRHDRPRVDGALDAIGYGRVPRPDGEHVTHQQIYTARKCGVDIVLDVHWKISDPQVFADVLSYDELAERAAAVPALGPHARTPSPAHALVIACVHRVAHHFDHDCLQFLCDIDRLVRAMSDEGWTQVLVIAEQKRVRAVVGRGLELAAADLNAPVPAFVTDELASATASEPSAEYLGRRLRKVDVLRSDLRTLGAAGKIRLIAEHLFPPKAFLLASTGPTPALLLPWRYAERIFRGASRWFRRLN